MSYKCFKFIICSYFKSAACCQFKMFAFVNLKPHLRVYCYHWTCPLDASSKYGFFDFNFMEKSLSISMQFDLRWPLIAYQIFANWWESVQHCIYLQAAVLVYQISFSVETLYSMISFRYCSMVCCFQACM